MDPHHRLRQFDGCIFPGNCRGAVAEDMNPRPCAAGIDHHRMGNALCMSELGKHDDKDKHDDACRLTWTVDSAEQHTIRARMTTTTIDGSICKSCTHKSRQIPSVQSKVFLRFDAMNMLHQRPSFALARGVRLPPGVPEDRLDRVRITQPSPHSLSA